MDIKIVIKQQSLNINRNKLLINRFVWILIIFCSAVLFTSSIFRAATFPFTCDESLSYAIINWQPDWGYTANNHLLNTFFMWVCSILFGNSELSLRLPNVLAHAIYLICGMLIIKRLQNTILRIAGFVMINLNLFLLDFFFLARGYGLALAFEMLSIYLLIRTFEERKQVNFKKYLYLSVFLGSLAVLANFAFLNYYIPLIITSGIHIILNKSKNQIYRQWVIEILAFITANVIFLSCIIFMLIKLQQGGELYFGGKNNFINDTVASLLQASLYSTINYSQLTVQILLAIIIGLFCILLLLGFYFCLRKNISTFVLFLFIFLIAVLMPILEHNLFHILFPIERTALYYIPLFMIILIFAFNSLYQLVNHQISRYLLLIIPTLIIIILGTYFCKGFNLHFCYSWGYDRHDNEIFAIINQDRIQNNPGKIVKLGNSWYLEPSLNYYRITRNYKWLAPITREQISRESDDYIYANNTEIRDWPSSSYIILDSYSDTQTILLRVNH